MRFTTLACILLPLLASPSCTSRLPHLSGEPEMAWSSAAEVYLSAYDRLEGHFHGLCGLHQEHHGQDPLFIEARAVAEAAEELYLLGEYRQALEILQQAIDLLEERKRVEETHR